MQKARFVIFAKNDPNLGALKEKGRGEENVYFSEQERNLIKNLLKKMETQNVSRKQNLKHEDTTDDDIPHIGHKEHKHVETLKQIFERHGIKDDSTLIKDLNEW
eukprot:CAMPEP_0168334580 /NCGR_PEP_ID=MMETSP0213-20121227/10362_1 /TAXON_ID=151035 /ORGANISM="Euplotes harpa, Strain FSP1.4" /LENGTH=103 /DNA_ID=CAMNT_0008339271 /DNA_START=122 /DNA_END=430 /DNA_ORIENTATION=+